MTCSKTVAKGPVMVYSGANATTWLFFPLTGPMVTTQMDKARTALELENASGNVQVQPALQHSDDGVTWDAAVYFGDAQTTTERTTDGTTYETSFTALPTPSKTFVRLGVRVKNSSGTAFAAGLASIRVETRSN
ncbi:MAG: hypothetical protein D6798_00550 [Deltaproteobacteria bacterium]|nr:MAG: hypothetical protein D6798_00550 [Deltaproteobacteria bacterium]